MKWRMSAAAIVVLALWACIELPGELPPARFDAEMEAGEDGAGGGTGGVGGGQQREDAGVDDRVDAGPAPEVCNRLDDDLDDSIDEGVRNACGVCGAVPVETCDTYDNDCDLIIDEAEECACEPGVEEACGRDIGPCVPGLRRCSQEGQWGPCSNIGPESEVCNDIDDDCDGDTDEDVQNACGGCGPLPDETCNGADDDCDGILDGLDADGDLCDCAVGSVEPCGTDVGACVAGRRACDFDGWGPCEGAVEAGEERCNQIDDDCDGSTDEDACDCQDGETRPCGLAVGYCREGTETCTAGLWGGCEGERRARPEICNDVDDDCDGAADEGDACDCRNGEQRPCGVDLGRCQPGTQTCAGGGWGVCQGAVEARDERCDGLDDDCDGAIDERWPTLGDPCSEGVGACRDEGVISCQGAQAACDAQPGAPGLEICNNIDDDCDGRTDENVQLGACDTGQRGVCADGMQSCVGGQIRCNASTQAGDETCDGRDEDCDGRTDEGTGGAACQTGDPGRCAAGTWVCDGGDLECRRNREPAAETCNGVDQDCDGTVDEGAGGGACDTGDPGRCSSGVRQCDDGQIVCVPRNGPVDETCNGVDQDCDGTVDEGTGGGACDTGDPGRCAGGTNQCQNGQLVCVAQNGPIDETCNGVDQDCDGTVDENTGGAVCTTGEPGRCSSGTRQCQNGQLNCVRQNGPVNETCNGQDDDCDGAVDDPPLLMGVECQVRGNGICATGVPICVAGNVECDTPDPRNESCNGLDDDCDGATDERLGGQDCNTGQAGVCASGTTACTNGAMRCVQNTQSRAEGEVDQSTCNGLDDDCDGTVDEGHPRFRDCELGRSDYFCAAGRVSACAINPDPEPFPDPEPIPR